MMRTIQLALTIALLSSQFLFSQTLAPNKWVAPEYPIIAKQFEESGVVSAALSIRPDGSIANVTMFGSRHNRVADRFRPAVHEAVLQWKYPPVLNDTIRTSVVYFVFHLYPPDFPEKELQPELIAPNTVIIKARIQKFEPETIS
ncbi:energy transducer TonB [Geothrix limicola]|uniref:energy transducer TonB n=1 Tax=Geothrix limicola TaxID=2927978 RepID=UPI002554C8AF|nr:energy transducer TonB [Geothrix limicola]